MTKVNRVIFVLIVALGSVAAIPTFATDFCTRRLDWTQYQQIEGRPGKKMKVTSYSTVCPVNPIITAGFAPMPGKASVGHQFTYEVVPADAKE